MKNRIQSKSKEQEKFLKRLGYKPSTEGAVGFPDLSAPSGAAPLSNTIPSNGTKSISMEKSNFANSNYTIAPAYSKGAYQLISKNDLENMGKKI